MKKIFIALMIIMLFQLLLSCNKSWSKLSILTDIDKEIINNDINGLIIESKRLGIDSISNEYRYINSIKNLSAFILSSNHINNDTRDSIIYFFKLIQYADMNVDENNIDKILNLSIDQIKDKILMYEYLSIQRLTSRYRNSFFIYKLGKPILHTESQIVKLGEEFRIDFYFACINNDYRDEIVINSDTIDTYYGNIPYYNFKPKRKGYDTLRGYFIHRNPYIDIFVNEFEMPYKVE